MHLITMAHLGEAQGVIETFRLKRHSPSVFKGDELTCLITGEGPFEAATTTAHELGKAQYKKVINLGIAGCLNHLPVGSLHPVRSFYLIIEGKPQFKSFKSFDQGLDCLTSFERILNPDKAKALTGLGSLVDREGWGVAMATKNASLPFESYKLISDQAGTIGACEMVKEAALEWSLKLAEKLKEILNVPLDVDSGLELPGFYFTFSTQHQFQEALNKLTLREGLTTQELMDSLPLNELRELKLQPKERTKLLLTHIENRLDPLKGKLDSALKAWKSPFERKGIQLQTDPTWESADVKIQFTTTNQDDLEDKLRILSDLSLDPFYKLRDGHVE